MGEWILTRSERAQEAFGVLENVLYLAPAAGYISIHIYKSSLNCTLKICVLYCTITQFLKSKIILKGFFLPLEELQDLEGNASLRLA